MLTDMHGEHMGALRLFDASGMPVWSESGPHGDEWLTAFVNIATPSFRFEYTRGNGAKGDVAITTVVVSCGFASPPLPPAPHLFSSVPPLVPPATPPRPPHAPPPPSPPAPPPESPLKPPSSHPMPSPTPLKPPPRPPPSPPETPPSAPPKPPPPEAGLAFCTLCPVGKFQDQRGALGCKQYGRQRFELHHVPAVPICSLSVLSGAGVCRATTALKAHLCQHHAPVAHGTMSTVQATLAIVRPVGSGTLAALVASCRSHACLARFPPCRAPPGVDCSSIPPLIVTVGMAVTIQGTPQRQSAEGHVSHGAQIRRIPTTIISRITTTVAIHMRIKADSRHRGASRPTRPRDGNSATSRDARIPLLDATLAQAALITGVLQLLSVAIHVWHGQVFHRSLTAFVIYQPTSVAVPMAGWDVHGASQSPET